MPCRSRYDAGLNDLLAGSDSIPRAMRHRERVTDRVEEQGENVIRNLNLTPGTVLKIVAVALFWAIAVIVIITTAPA